MAAMVSGRRGALAVVGLVLFGCGGSFGESPQGCLTVRPCGGDLVGTWRFVRSCTADPGTLTAVAGARCAGTTVSSYSLTVSGSVTFNADLTYVARDWTSSYNQTSTFPKSCGGGTSCAEQSFSVTLDDDGFSNQSCSGSDDCVCDASGRGTATETGRYGTSGLDFHLEGPTWGGTSRYCIKEPFLHIIEEGFTSTDTVTPVVIVADTIAIRE